MNKKPDVLNILRAIPSYAGLDKTIIEDLARYFIRRYYDSGQAVFLEGDPCAGYHVVQEGWLKAFKISTAGCEQIIQFLGPGKTFNEEAVITGSTNQVTVEALEPSTVWIIHREDMLKLMSDHPHFSSIITEELANRVIYLTKLIENLAL